MLHFFDFPLQVRPSWYQSQLCLIFCHNTNIHFENIFFLQFLLFIYFGQKSKWGPLQENEQEFQVFQKPRGQALIWILAKLLNIDRQSMCIFYESYWSGVPVWANWISKFLIQNVELMCHNTQNKGFGEEILFLVAKNYQKDTFEDHFKK